MASSSGEWLRVMLPYCLAPLTDGTYIAVNREYAPVGHEKDGWVDYEALPITLRFRLTENQKIALAHDGTVRDDGSVYLYDDGCVPTSDVRAWGEYAKRLSVLAKAKRSPRPG